MVSTLIFALLLLLTGRSVVGQSSFDDYSAHQEDGEVSEFLSNPETFNVEVGEEITFPCHVRHLGEKPIVFEFSSLEDPHMERLYFAGDNRVSVNTRLSKEDQTFRLRNIKRTDAGLYHCKLYDPPLVVTHKLSVKYPATIQRISPAHQKVSKGDTVVLQCEADGNPDPAILWRKRGGQLPSGSHPEKGLSITLENVDRHEAGTYECTAANGVGNPSSSEMVLEVEYEPEIFTEEAILHTGDGDEAKLVCVVHGHPKPEVMWTRGGNVVKSSRHKTHDTDHRHTLIIKQVQEQDFGEYTCSASNIKGTSSSTLELTGIPRVPKLTSSPAGGEMASYTLTWETESFSPIIQYRVKYRRHNVPQQNNPRRPQVWEDELHFPPTPSSHIQRSSDRLQLMAHPIRNLQPATDYEAVVSVENKFGWSKPSTAFVFHTRKEMADGHSASSSGTLLVTTPLFALTLLLV